MKCSFFYTYIFFFQAKYYMATETRNALIAGHMNARHAVRQEALPYWNDADDKVIIYYYSMFKSF